MVELRGGLACSIMFCLAVALWPASARADELDDERLAYRALVVEELRAESVAAADKLTEGDAFSDAERLDDARASYDAAAKLAPKSPHPLRRLCGIASSQGRGEEAVRLCRAARALRDDATQRAALAGALSVTPARPEDLKEAYALASALASSGRSLYNQAIFCEVARVAERADGIAKCSKALEAGAPNSVATWMYVAIREANADNAVTTRAALVRARELGAKGIDEMIARLDAATKEAEPAPLIPPWVLPALIVWASLLALVTLMGFVLSAATRHAAYRLPPTPTGHAHGATAVVRQLYRFVLWLACALFYASLPIMLASVVALVIGLVYLSFMVGRVPIKLVLIFGLVAVLTIYATLRSLFVRVDRSDPGERLDLAEHPRLDALLAEVAARIETRKVDTVFFTGGTEIAVFERGGVISRLRGARRERCLILGAGVLGGMKLIELKAILAHEYGHFHNEDTAGGGFALAVRRLVSQLVIGLATSGAATWYNPAWWMARGFFALFIRLSHGASRLQEILADRWAAFAYGAAAFESGLTHAVRRGVEFPRAAELAIDKALSEHHAITNLYGLQLTDTADIKKMEDAFAEALEDPASPYDTHPSPKERFELVHRLDAPTPEGEDLEALAWSVFADRDALERTMTAETLQRLEDRFEVEGLVARSAD